MIALIDADHLAVRNYYAHQHRTGFTGQPTGAIYGFLTSLRAICRQLQPQILVVCWGDRRENLWRRKILPSYKAKRSPPPEQYISQIQNLQTLLQCLGLCQVLCPTFEADDVIGAITADCIAADKEVGIITGDHDLFQLIREERPVVHCYVSVKKRGYQRVTSLEVKEKFGVSPELLPRFMALRGENGDGVPGVPGVGPKRAAEYLRGEATPRVAAKIKDNQRIVERNLNLVTLTKINSENLTPSTLGVMPREYDEVRALALLRKIGLTGVNSVLSEVRSMIGSYQEIQVNGAHSLSDILVEVENGGRADGKG